jgi:hypothetical protein
MSVNLVVVYHPKCKPSTDFIIKTKQLKGIDIEYINILDDKIETQIEIDVVPLIIVDNDEHQIYKGKRAFDKLDELISQPNKNKPDKSLKYVTKGVTFKHDDGKKQTIDLSQARP